MRSRMAFTLLEMLLATALLVVLMVGVMAVIARLGAGGLDASIGRGGAPGVDGSMIDALVALLAEDIQQAEQVDASVPGQLRLAGFLSVDQRHRGRTHRPVEVVYEVRRIGGRDWMVRRQTALDGRSDDRQQVDLVCVDVSGFEVVARGAMAGAGAGAAPVRAAEAGVGAEGAGESGGGDDEGGAVDGGPSSSEALSILAPADGVYYQGSHYFRKYAPAGALKDPSVITGGRVPGDAAVTADGASGAPGAAADAEQTVVARAWYLKVRGRDGSSEPVSRFLGIRWGGA